MYDRLHPSKPSPNPVRVTSPPLSSRQEVFERARLQPCRKVQSLNSGDHRGKAANKSVSHAYIMQFNSQPTGQRRTSISDESLDGLSVCEADFWGPKAGNVWIAVNSPRISLLLGMPHSTWFTGKDEVKGFNLCADRLQREGQFWRVRVVDLRTAVTINLRISHVVEADRQ